jgi:hypothetical protein
MPLSESLTARLKNQYESIHASTAGIDQVKLITPPAENKWSIHDIIAHLAKYQPVFLDRINAILTHDEPAFERYVADNDPLFSTWRARSTGDLLQALKDDRAALFNKITSLGDSELERTGLHPKFGRLTINQWTEFFILHEAHHLFVIFQLARS